MLTIIVIVHAHGWDIKFIFEFWITNHGVAHMYSHVYSLDLHNVVMHHSVYLHQAEAPICLYHPHNNVGVVNFMLIS